MSGVRIPPPRPLFPASPLGVSGASRSRAKSCARALMVAVAHQVEHRIVAPEVAGSRPVSHPILLVIALVGREIDRQDEPVSSVGELYSS